VRAERDRRGGFCITSRRADADAAADYAGLMADGRKVLVNLSTGMEDPERVMIAFLVATAALEQGKQVAVFLTKDAVRVSMPGVAVGVACDGCPPIERLFEQFESGGGELLVCPICFSSRKLAEGELVSNARLAGATPMWQWVGDEAATVFSY
jgi:predicted peroxiredoxin